MKNILNKSLLALGVAALMFTSSCSKKDAVYGGGSSSNNDPMISKIKTVIGNLPHFKAANSAGINRKDGGTMTTQGGWDFSNPGNGYSYSSPNGISYSSNSNTFMVATTSGGNAGGTVVAGASALDMNYTFCFSIDDQVNGLSAFGTGAPSTGVSGVIGISGDFSKLSGSATDFSDVFKGLAYYIVYDGKASGSYDVIDWNDPKLQSNLNNTSGNSPVNKKCFAILIDFKNLRMYLSSSGKINVGGGTMDFNGEYLEVSGYKVDSNGNYDLSNLTYKTVPGFGAMGCN